MTSQFIKLFGKKITYDVEEEERGSTTNNNNLCTAIQNIQHNNIIRKDRGWYHKIEKRSDHYIWVCILKYYSIMSAVGSGSFLVVDTSTNTA